MIERIPCVYILAPAYNGTIYVGVTSNLVGRMMQHRAMDAAIRRKKQLKRWRREWKRNLIERQNPEWNDLAVSLGLEALAVLPSGAVDPGTRPG